MALRINGAQHHNNQQFSCVLRFHYCYAKCHYAECHYAECHYAECHYAECIYAACHYAECHYAECHYAECHNAECRGAKFYQAILRAFLRQLSEMKKSKNLLEKL